jgi:hypothetical protein
MTLEKLMKVIDKTVEDKVREAFETHGPPSQKTVLALMDLQTQMSARNSSGTDWLKKDRRR